MILTEEQQLPSQLKILFLDDHAGLRDSLGGFLSNKNPNLKFFYAGNKEDALKVLSENPDIKNAIIDINLNGINGLDLIPAFRNQTSDLNVIVYSMYNDVLHVEQALKKNIQGFISKDASLNEVEKAIQVVSTGNIYYNKTTREIMASMFNTEKSENNQNESSYSSTFYNYRTLRQKEKILFELLAQQKEVSEIAKILGKAEKTINNQTSIMYQKLNIHNRLELLKIAKILGVII